MSEVHAQPANLGAGEKGGVGRPALHCIMGLAAQFLIGMGINLIGLPSQTVGTAHVATTVLLVGHIVVAIAIAIGALEAVRAAEKGGRERRLALIGAAVVVVTIGAGALTVATSSNWWSYLMAVGFLAALLIYVALLVRAPRERARQ